MRICTCLLAAVAVLAGCDGTDVVGVSDERPQRHLEEATMMPFCSALYRAGGTHDPASPVYDPTVADTALLHVSHTFVWNGRGPHGACDPLLFRYRMDGDAFSAWGPDTSCVVSDLTDGEHEMVVLPGCPAATGIERSFGLVVNFDPDSRIVEPVEPSGTLTVSDGDTLWVRAVAHDREELEGVGGGVAQVVLEMDGNELVFVPPDPVEWWWNSNAAPGSGHHISGSNPPQGGNGPHMIRVSATDVDGRCESNGESYVFRYNYPPVVNITYPAEDDTVGSDFTVEWEGHDPDGHVDVFQYVLDPGLHAYSTTDQSETTYTGIDGGPHEFRIRARDGSGCWSETWSIVHFYVE